LHKKGKLRGHDGSRLKKSAHALTVLHNVTCCADALPILAKVRSVGLLKVFVLQNDFLESEVIQLFPVWTALQEFLYVHYNSWQQFKPVYV